MEATNDQRLFNQILPPKLEDAGLEDCALPTESIHEAFLKAAAAVESRATCIFSPSSEEIECVPDSLAGKEISDKLVGLSLGTDCTDVLVGLVPEIDDPGTCVVEKGCGQEEDEVVIGRADASDVEGERECCCVDVLQGLDVEGGNGDQEEEESDGKRPILVQGFVWPMRKKGNCLFMNIHLFVGLLLWLSVICYAANPWNK